MSKDLIDALSNLSLIDWVVGVLFLVVVDAAILYSFIRWSLRRQWRLYRSLKRPIVFLPPVGPDGTVIPGFEMAREKQLVRQNGFLKLSDGTTDYRDFDPSGKHCIVVMGYRSGMTGLDDILNRVKTHHVPLIVYSFGEHLPQGEEKGKLEAFPLTLYANFPLTLLNQIFATVASYPYD